MLETVGKKLSPEAETHTFMSGKQVSGSKAPAVS